MTTVERSFEYRGDLAQTALPEMLFTIHRFQVPGVIEAVSGSVVKRVFIKEGNVIHASSSDREDSLGAHLVRTSVLDSERIAVALREREVANRRLGVLLIERGLLPPETVFQAIREQIESIVWSLFYWQKGGVTFNIGDFRDSEMVQILLPLRQVILRGIKRAPNAKALVARLGRKETVFEPSYQTEGLIEVALDDQEYRLLAMVDGRRSLFEICTQGPLPPADAARLMYAFRVLQLIRTAQPVAERAESQGAIRIRFKTEGDRYSA